MAAAGIYLSSCENFFRHAPRRSQVPAAPLPPPPPLGAHAALSAKRLQPTSSLTLSIKQTGVSLRVGRCVYRELIGSSPSGKDKRTVSTAPATSLVLPLPARPPAGLTLCSTL
ncbi:unnamed protein product [Pleuronectes platessa]|uniref:Uncharacterized protein n=1 Tax=Pleuronectes platessa TaxID=8262 RepID=A0A9N7URJ0_PLEPL|nr:unnamed protein product [Pleuronectes platessa]